MTTRVKEKLVLTPDVPASYFDEWDGSLNQLAAIVDSYIDEYGLHKKIVIDAGYSNVSFMIDNSDVRNAEQAVWDAKYPKKLTKGKLDEHKNKVIIDLLKHAGVKLTKKEINERITTGKGFDDLLKT